MDSKNRKAHIAKRKAEGARFPDILREMHPNRKGKVPGPMPMNRAAMADGGDVEPTRYERMRKAQQYRLRGKEPPAELMPTDADATEANERAANVGPRMATTAAELTGVPSIMRGSENIVGGISEGDGLRAARGAGEVVMGAAPGLGVAARAGLGAAREVGKALYGSLPRIGATTAASMAPGVLDDAYAETKADYARTGSAGSEPSILDAAKRLVAGRDFTPVSDEDFRRQYSTRNPLPQRLSEQDYVDQQVKRFQESPGYQALIELKQVTRANNQARDVAAKAAADYRSSYGNIFDQQIKDWDRQYQGERTRYLDTLKAERLDYQKKPFAERNPGINALTYVVPAAIAAQRYGARIDRNAADVRRLMQVAEDTTKPVTARIAAQKDLAEVMRNTPQTGVGKALEAAKYGAGGGALSVLMGTGQDLADTFYLDADSEARKRASMKYVPIDDQGNTDFGPMKDMLKNNAQRVAIMSGAVGSVPLFKSGLSTAENTAANRVARGPDLFDMDNKRAALAKVQEIERRGISDSLDDVRLRNELRQNADETQQDAVQRALLAATERNQSGLRRETMDRLTNERRNALQGWAPDKKWTEAELDAMLGRKAPPPKTQRPPQPPANTPNPPPPPPANTNPVSLDEGTLRQGLAAVQRQSPNVWTDMLSNQSTADAKLRSLISMQTGKPGKSVTTDELNEARRVLSQYAAGKKDGGPVGRAMAKCADGGAISKALRAATSDDHHSRRQNRYARGGTVHRKGMFKRGMKDC